jgi:Lon protease-like protein
MPMFPLGSPLLPRMLLPLRIFEPRYRELADAVLTTDRRFGVVMIERGSEVGGGDVRVDVGCVAEVIGAEQLADGGWMLACVGTDRVRITEWLDDDPYPRALVELWPDEPDVDEEEVAIEVAYAKFHEMTSLLVEIGALDDPAIELDDDPGIAAYQMALGSPLGPFDRHRLLTRPSASTRVALLGELLDDAMLLIQAQRDGP